LSPTSYDIILAGAGLSGLTLAVGLARHPAFAGRRLLLLDRDAKTRNDRTWCFWADDDEPLPPVVAHTWDRCRFYSPTLDRALELAPYRYRMVRGADFYAWARAALADNPRVDWIQTTIDRLDAGAGRVETAAGVFTAPVIFNSAFTRRPVLPLAGAVYRDPPLTAAPGSTVASRYTYLLQHFKGWHVRTAQPVFDPAEATLMDFRIEQAGETRFVYVLPFSPTEALVEFTVFSPALLAGADYDAALSDYLRRFLQVDDYTVLEAEFGVIPMTDDPFRPTVDGRVIHIGTAGGFVKGSSGYAFKRTQRRLRAFIDAWGHAPDAAPPVHLLRSPWRNRLYDSILLRVLRDRTLAGERIFSGLFGQLPAALVLRFLDEDTTFAEDWRVLNAPPKAPFIRAALQQLPFYFSV
jgi:lycopene beta-cyclase